MPYPIITFVRGSVRLTGRLTAQQAEELKAIAEARLAEEEPVSVTPVEAPTFSEPDSTAEVSTEAPDSSATETPSVAGEES